MKSAIAILTYNRVGVLKTMLAGIKEHCNHYPVAIFDDCSNRDSTEAFLLKDATKVASRYDLQADDYSTPHGYRVFISWRNIGVAAQSNRAIKWFIEETQADHLCLCNDDLDVLGNFPAFYAKVHEDLGVGLLSFSDFTEPTYEWAELPRKGYLIKLHSRMTGIMLSFTRKVVEEIGYFDARFKKFGQDHVDYQHRARFAGFSTIGTEPQTQIDVQHHRVGQKPNPMLKHQVVDSSIPGPDNAVYQQQASAIFEHVSRDYHTASLYRPFRLSIPEYTGCAQQPPIRVDEILHVYDLVEDVREFPLVLPIAKA